MSNKVVGFASVLAYVLLAVACSGATIPTTTSHMPSVGDPAPPSTTSLVAGPKRVIVDYSPTVSDVGGFLYLLAHPDVEVVAVSIPLTGEAGCELGLQVTLGVLTLMEQQHIPVACGRHLSPDAESWPKPFLETQTNLKFGLPAPLADEDDRTGAALIVDVVRSSDRPVTIWAVAPLTNVAQALLTDPTIALNIEEIVIMGGAVGVDGNVFDSPAEWNFYIDAAAGETVLSSGVPITLVALDATNDVPVPAWFASALERAEPSSGIAYLSDLIELFDTPSVGFYYMWDELAAAVVAESVDITTEEANLTVVVGGPASGQTARTDSGSSVNVATGVLSPDDFYTDFISVLAGSDFMKVEATAEEEAYLLSVGESLTELGNALAATFAPGSPFDADDFDGEAIADALTLVFDALVVTSETVEKLNPPSSLAHLHVAYLEEVHSDLELREPVLDTVRTATTFEEIFSSFAGFSDGAACEAMGTEAFFLGVDVAFPCNP